MRAGAAVELLEPTGIPAREEAQSSRGWVQPWRRPAPSESRGQGRGRADVGGAPAVGAHHVSLAPQLPEPVRRLDGALLVARTVGQPRELAQLLTYAVGVHATVVELWRYPVKSLLGEQLQAVQVEQRGLAGDRLYAVADREGKLGSGKTTRRFRRLDGLFELRARTRGDRPLVTLSDGRELEAGDPELDAFLSERYGDELRVACESTVPHHDAAPLHLLSTSSLRWLANNLPASEVDRRRFRPNVLLDVAGADLLDDAWVGRRFALGSAAIRVVERTERCVMTTNAQSELPKDPDILRAVTELNGACLGVFASVEEPGVVRVGDSLRPL